VARLEEQEEQEEQEVDWLTNEQDILQVLTIHLALIKMLN